MSFPFHPGNKKAPGLMNRNALYLISSLSLGLLTTYVVADESVVPNQLMEMPHSTHKLDTLAEKPEWLLLAQAASSKAEAAQIAKSRHGGKVLSVRKSGNGWQVKLLLDGKRVKMVYVEGNSGDSK